MTDEYSQDDPRLGTSLEEWQPTASQRARTVELLYFYVARNPEFKPLFLAYCDDCLKERSMPSLMLAVLELVACYLNGCMGEPLAVARLAGDVEQARRDIIEYGETQ